VDGVGADLAAAQGRVSTRWQVTIIDNGTAGGGAHVVLRSDSGEERRVALTMADLDDYEDGHGRYQLGAWMEEP
jgi:hypothetical protein